MRLLWKQNFSFGFGNIKSLKKEENQFTSFRITNTPNFCMNEALTFSILILHKSNFSHLNAMESCENAERSLNQSELMYRHCFFVEKTSKNHYRIQQSPENFGELLKIYCFCCLAAGTWELNFFQSSKNDFGWIQHLMRMQV